MQYILQYPTISLGHCKDLHQTNREKSLLIELLRTLKYHKAVNLFLPCAVEFSLLKNLFLRGDSMKRQDLHKHFGWKSNQSLGWNLLTGWRKEFGAQESVCQSWGDGRWWWWWRCRRWWRRCWQQQLIAIIITFEPWIGLSCLVSSSFWAIKHFKSNLQIPQNIPGTKSGECHSMGAQGWGPDTLKYWVCVLRELGVLEEHMFCKQDIFWFRSRFESNAQMYESLQSPITSHLKNHMISVEITISIKGSACASLVPIWTFNKYIPRNITVRNRNITVRNWNISV